MLVKSQVKYIQSLSQKKVRDEEGLFVAEGPKIINDLLHAGNLFLHQLFATEAWLQENSATAGLIDSRQVIQVNDKEMERLSFLKTPHEVLAVFRKPVFKGPLKWEGRWTLLLDTIQDPGNLGTIIRSADWFGVDQVVCSVDSADWLNPKVVQATMGSIARVRVEYQDLAAILENNQQVPVYAAVLEGTPLDKMKSSKEDILIIGNESKGIHPSLLNASINKVTIPRKGGAESLNAAVATGILLSHLT